LGVEHITGGGGTCGTGGEIFDFFCKEKMGLAGNERLFTALRIRIRQLKRTPDPTKINVCKKKGLKAIHSA
jgi:hypothetical protein